MSNKNDSDPTWTLFLLIAFAGAVLYIVWFIFKTEIMEGMRWLRFAELYLIGFLDPHYHACANWIRTAQVASGAPTDNLPTPDAFKWSVACFGSSNLQNMPAPMRINYYNITPDSLGIVADMVGQVMRWPTAAGGIWLAIYASFFTPRNKFKTRYTLETFIKAQAQVWPAIAPIVNMNPSKKSARIPGDVIPENLPIFAEALSPEEWLSYHRIPLVNNIPDREATRRALQMQLGLRWQDTESLPPHIMALFAAFALRGTQKREESDDLLGRLSRCWSEQGGFVMSAKLHDEIRKIALDPDVGGKALAVAEKHAYRTTAMIGILKWARFNGGVLASAQFVWLRSSDRPLWYALNNLGRRTFHAEGAGAMAHYMAELAAQKPLPTPRLDTAIVTINQYLATSDAKVPPREETETSQRLLTSSAGAKVPVKS